MTDIPEGHHNTIFHMSHPHLRLEFKPREWYMAESLTNVIRKFQNFK